jgi:nitrogenase delta subunit
MKLDEITDLAQRDQVAQLEDYIMKNCLWQFHSREWDRVRQNDNIFGQATQLLCNEPVDISTLELKCYWVDALSLKENFQKKYTWINNLGSEQVKDLMNTLKARIDFLTITGSLNEELTAKLY